MLTLEIVFALLFGLALGSFLNVCIGRLPRHQSIVRPPSHCPQCNAQLAAYDNIPLVSYALLRGRCRHCQNRIGWRYPLVEALAAVITVTCMLVFGLSFDGIAIPVFCLMLLALAVCDAETLRLPDSLTWPLLGLGLLYRMAGGLLDGRWNGTAYAWQNAVHHGLRGSISAVATASFFLLLRSLYWLLRRRHGMGLGDVKLAAGIAAWLGLRRMGVVFFLAVVAGALITLCILAIRRRESATTEGPLAVPFGTFLCSAALYGAFFGQPTLLWYLHFFP